MTVTKLRPSFTFTEERLARLREVVPEAFADGRVNWDVLREVLGNWLEADEIEAEHFGLTWPGKREARRLAAMPGRGTLVPAPGEGVNEGTTRNLFIEGDNLEVLKLLHKSYAGRVKTIYIDPPYNTGNDFVYDDDFSDPLEDYLQKTGQMDDEGRALTTNKRADGRFHSNWLSMMYPRLLLARNLLQQTGAIFVSINDNEVHNLRQIMSEIFGEENFVAQIVWQRSKRGDSKVIALIHEYILCFARDRNAIVQAGGWRRRKRGVDEVLAHYAELRQTYGSDHASIRKGMRDWYKSLDKQDRRRAHEHYNWSDERGLYFAADFAGPDDGRKSRPRHDIPHPITGKSCAKPSTGWRWDEVRTKAALAEDPPRIHFGPDHTTIPTRKSYLAEIDYEPYPSVFYRDGRSATLEVESLVGKGVFAFPKNVDVIAELIELASDPDDIVLDFFAGSGTTAHAVLDVNRRTGSQRRYIVVQLPEPVDNAGRYRTIAEICKARIRAVAKRMTEEAGPTEDIGFRVYRLDRSNFRGWQDYDGDDLGELESLFAQAETPLLNGWTAERLLPEVMLLEGFPLDSSAGEKRTERRHRVSVVESAQVRHRLIACFDKKLDDGVLGGLELREDDVFVCLDSAITDRTKMRLADRCTLRTI